MYSGNAQVSTKPRVIINLIYNRNIIRYKLLSSRRDYIAKRREYMKAFLCIKEYKDLKSYPSMQEQLRLAKEYADYNGLTVANLLDWCNQMNMCVSDMVDFCVSNKMECFLAYDYRALAYKSIDRVKLSRKLYHENIKILFFGEKK